MQDRVAILPGESEVPHIGNTEARHGRCQLRCVAGIKFAFEQSIFRPINEVIQTNLVVQVVGQSISNSSVSDHWNLLLLMTLIVWVLLMYFLQYTLAIVDFLLKPERQLIGIDGFVVPG